MYRSLLQVSEKGLSMLRFSSVCLLSAAAFASASAISDNTAKIDSTVQAIESRRGVDVGGTVRAVYANSHVSSDQDVNAYNNMPDREVAEFVQLDLDFAFRPWDFVRVNAKMRAFAGMQDYFAASATALNFPWVNVEGNIGSNFYWVIGDFRQQISPLTVFAPGVDVLYEPVIFARNKEMAKKDALIEGNQRNMQGVNLQYRTFIGEALGELRAEAFFARLRRGEYLDHSGYEGNLLPNESSAGSSQAGAYDKYALAGNLEWFPLNRNLMLAGSYLWVFDDENSINRNYYYNQEDQAFLYRATADGIDSTAQNTQVASVRVGGDVAGFIGNKNLVLNLTAEMAFSFDDVYNYNVEEVKNEEGEKELVYTPVKEKDNGMAMNIDLSAGYKTDSWNAVVNATYIQNDSSWFNSLAQSPSFVARRILNSDKDGNLTKYGVYAPLYSSFDAMYYFTPRHSPVSSALSNVSPLGDKDQNKSYNIAPYSKTSYTAATYTRRELALIEQLSDPNLQVALPNGLATSNRSGVTANLVAGYGPDNAIEVQGLFTMVEQVKSILETGEKMKYVESGAGAKIDVLKLLGFSTSLELSGSYKYSTREIAEARMNSDFLNAGLYWRFYKRFGVAAGLQMINTHVNPSMGNLQKYSVANFDIDVVPIAIGEQMQWMVGLDYTVAPHAWLSLNYGMMNVKNEYRTIGMSKAEAWSNSNLPDYIDRYVGAIEADESGNINVSKITHEFSRSVIEATINVEF